MIDSSSIRIRQHAANAQKKTDPGAWVVRAAATKIHAGVDADGLPIALKLTLGQAHDGRSVEGMLESLG